MSQNANAKDADTTEKLPQLPTILIRTPYGTARMGFVHAFMYVGVIYEERGYTCMRY